MTAAKRLKGMSPSQVLEVLTDNQTSVDLTLPDVAKALGSAFYAERAGDSYRVFIAKR